MRWEAMNILHGLWALIPLTFLLLYLLKRRERRLTRLFEAEVLDTMIPARRKHRGRTRLLLWLCAVALMVTALARPQWGYTLEEVKRRSMEIMVLLDTSNSMLAQDIKPNRLQQAKWGIKDLVGRLNGDRVGLIAFAGGSFLQCPMTIDYAAFSMTLDDVYAGIIPRGGTEIKQALETAMKSFESKGEADKAIILITDGEDHEGNPLELVDELKKQNIRVYAIGVGTHSGELIPAVEEKQAGFFKNREGEVVKSALKDDVLKQLAIATQGAYVQSVPGDFGLERIVDRELSQLTRDDQESRMIKSYEERFVWALIPAFILLFFESVMSERRRFRQV